MERTTQFASRSRRMMAAGVSLAAVLVLGTGVAGADGTPTPVGAPTIRLGVTEFGNTTVPSSPRQEYYRLPPLKAGDVVTLAARTTGDTGEHHACLVGDVDGFNWQQEECNLARNQYFNHNGQRRQFRASRSTNNAFLRVYAWSRGGAYEVTVERIQHQVGLTMEAPASVKTK